MAGRGLWRHPPSPQQGRLLVPAPPPSVSVLPGNASGTGVAGDTGGPVGTTVAVNAGLASGVGAVGTPVVTGISPGTGAATGVGAAGSPAASIAVNTGVAAGTGAANAPTISTAVITQVTPGAASGTGAAPGPTVSIAPNAALAAGTGQAGAPSVTVAPKAGLAAGTGAAGGVTITAVPSPAPGAASGTGAAPAPVANVRPNAGLAAGVGQAYSPTVPTITFVAPGNAGGLGAAPAPTVRISPTMARAQGTGAAIAPKASIAVRPTTAAGTAVAQPAIVLGQRGRVRRIEYHLMVYSPDANGGPGAPKMELDPDALNVTWTQGQNTPGAMAFAMYRRNKKAGDLLWMQDHVKLFRETNAGIRTVFAGKLVKPAWSANDLLAYCWDYTAFLQLSITGYRTAYPNVNIGTGVVLPEWNLAKGLTNSPFAFVANGTFEDPLGLDGVTAIKTNSAFGVIDFNRLFAFGTLAEMAMANTNNNVKFEITREAPHTFNFWKNYGSQQFDYVAVSPGNLAAYDLDAGYDGVRFDLRTVLSDGAGGHAEYGVQTSDANTTAFRRLQQALLIRTLFGIIPGGTTETDQGIASLRRQLIKSIRYPRLITTQPRQGEFDPFAHGDLGDIYRHTLQTPNELGDLYDGWVRWIEIVGTYNKDHGELLQLKYRGVP